MTVYLHEYHYEMKLFNEKGLEIKVPKTEPCGTTDIIFYNLLFFKVQGFQDCTEVLSKQTRQLISCKSLRLNF